jgi:hypothetical protein
MADAAVLTAQRQHGAETRTFDDGAVANHIYAPGVSWGAVVAGAFAGAALSLILLALGAGLGLSAVSPWSNMGVSASAIGRAAILWMIVMQILASSMAGYLAGRLRSKWNRIHTDEIYFRDTAHGFLAWSLGIVITAAFLTSAGAAMVGRTAAGAQSATSGGSNTAADTDEYFADMLIRPSFANASAANLDATASNLTPANPANDATVRRDVELIFSNGLRQGYLPGADQAYLAEVVAARTGISESDAEKHVSDDFAAAQQTADRTRKSIAHSLLWIFVALLIGAFCASLSATFGGAQRDHVVTV